MLYPIAVSKKQSDDALARELEAIPAEFRCFQVDPGSWELPVDYILLGVRQNDYLGWEQIAVLPERTKGFKFYIGGTHAGLFKAYANSSYPTQAEELFIGYSTEGYENDETQAECVYDYSEIVRILSSIKFPKLRKLSLGVSELFCNAHGTTGCLGDITQLLENMPNLERLHIGGNFELTRSVCLRKLESLEIEVVGEWEVPVTSPISEETQKNLLLSEFPRLRELWADLDCYETIEYGIAYSFPSRFLQLETMPCLERIEFQGFYKLGEKKKLEDSPLWRKANRKCSDINEIQVLAIDVHYEGDTAFVSGVTFSSFSQTSPSGAYFSKLKVPSEYQSGEFYKRELPCITFLLKEHKLKPDLIIVDGFVHLDDCGSKGLGAHLFDFLSENSSEARIIGVAKNPRLGVPEVWSVYRGESCKPLYVDSIGIRSDIARDLIRGMAGSYRVPKILKHVDRLCRDASNFVTQDSKHIPAT